MQRPAPAQQQQHHAPPPPAQQATPTTGGGMFSGIGGMVVQGMAFGAGSEIAHQAVRGIMGSGSGSHHQEVQQQAAPAQQQQQQQQQQAVCQDEQSIFARCLNQSNDIQSCQTYLDMLKECQKKYN